MSGSRVSSSDAWKARAHSVRDRFAASGTNISEWAREHGFSVSLVQAVLTGKRRCRRGESHQIAVALGIKDPASPPGRPETPSEQLEGIRP
ncbi:DNA-binding protein [Sphingobium sp.]|uniref:DNA-binding protein n=1 Tax=Sphingobium sp. TaxID=1912891 RepID=UPI0039C8EEA9